MIAEGIPLGLLGSKRTRCRSEAMRRLVFALNRYFTVLLRSEVWASGRVLELRVCAGTEGMAPVANAVRRAHSHARESDQV